MDIPSEVARFVDVCDGNATAGLDRLAEVLVAGGITAAEAEALIAFVPMGFAHALLTGSRVTLSKSFFVRDLETGETARGMLRDEPVFTAALALAERMLQDPATRDRAVRMAEGSAECNVVRKLCPDGQNIAGCVLTETLLVRLPLDYVRPPKRRSWWRFWK